MKKLFLTLALGLLCVAGFSQFTYEDGTYTYQDEYTTENAHRKVVNLLNTFNGTTQSAKITTNTDTLVKAEVVFNVKASYNPFAGSFVENFQMDVTFKIDGEHVTVLGDNFYTINVYSGYGSNKEVKSYDERKEEYDNASRKLNSGTLKGKDKKDAKSIVDDWEESSAAIDKEFKARFVNTLKKKLQ
ncbi:MAG: hypothetical protein K6F40_10055 [Bacteroidales bacterium]|nr:hypothetical protein [Bacteroidales bacterium]